MKSVFARGTLNIQGGARYLEDHREVPLKMSRCVESERSTADGGFIAARFGVHTRRVALFLGDSSKIVGRRQATARQVDIALTVPLYRYRNHARSKYSCRDIRDKKERSHERGRGAGRRGKKSPVTRPLAMTDDIQRVLLNRSSASSRMLIFFSLLFFFPPPFPPLFSVSRFFFFLFLLFLLFLFRLVACRGVETGLPAGRLQTRQVPGTERTRRIDNLLVNYRRANWWKFLRLVADRGKSRDKVEAV